SRSATARTLPASESTPRRPEARAAGYRGGFERCPEPRRSCRPAGGPMQATSRLVGLARWWASNVDRARAWLGLTWRGVCALAAAIVALVAAVALLGGVAEDVTQHNGLASSDAAHLRFFTDHRPDLVINAARIITNLGGVVVLALIAIAAGLFLWYRGVPMAALAVTIGAALLTRAVPPGSQPADGRVRRAAHGLGQMLTAARSPQREGKLRAA